MHYCTRAQASQVLEPQRARKRTRGDRRPLPRSPHSVAPITTDPRRRPASTRASPARRTAAPCRSSPARPPLPTLRRSVAALWRAPWGTFATARGQRRTRQAARSLRIGLDAHPRSALAAVRCRPARSAALVASRQPALGRTRTRWRPPTPQARPRRRGSGRQRTQAHRSYSSQAAGEGTSPRRRQGAPSRRGR